MSELIGRYDPPWSFSDNGITHPIYSAGVGVPVVAQPSLRCSCTSRRSARNACSACAMPAIIAPAERIKTIKQLIGPAFDYEEFPGNHHATLTVHRQPRALERTIAFLQQRLS